MNTEKRWKEIHKRLKKLNKADTEEEATLLGDAYDNLVIAYQEARETQSGNGTVDFGVNFYT